MEKRKFKLSARFKEGKMNFSVVLTVGCFSIFANNVGIVNSQVSFPMLSSLEKDVVGKKNHTNATRIDLHFSSKDLHKYYAKTEESSRLLNVAVPISDAEAKAISHSKGPYRTGKDGNLEYRRSLIKKLQMKTNSVVLKNVMNYFEDGNEEVALNNLEALKHLVHEYDTAIEFANSGGMELMKEFMQYGNKKIASASFSVLSAAMQGNPHVQKVAFKNNILDIIIEHLLTKDYLPKILYALSSHLRLMPEAEIKFIEKKGVFLLVDIIKNHTNTLDFRMHAIQILADMSYELFEENSIDIQKHQKSQLKGTFHQGIRSSSACQEISMLLQCNEFSSICKANKLHPEYHLHERILKYMYDLRISCYKIFQFQTVRKSVERLFDLYDPLNELPWYSNVDKEFKWKMYQDIMDFYEIIYNKRYVRKVEL